MLIFVSLAFGQDNVPINQGSGYSSIFQSFSVENFFQDLITTIVKQQCGRQGGPDENYNKMMVSEQ